MLYTEKLVLSIFTYFLMLSSVLVCFLYYFRYKISENILFCNYLKL